MKSVFLALTLMFSASFATAQEEATSLFAPKIPAGERFAKNWILSGSTMIWNEALELRSGINEVQDVANFGVFLATIRREFTSEKWGFHVGAFVGAGRVNGGGNENIAYSQSNVPVSIIGATPRVFYNLSDRINVGASSMVFLKSVTWPEKAPIRVASGRSLNAALLLDINIRLFENWEFNQGLGGVSEGNTVWQLGISRRF